MIGSFIVDKLILGTPLHLLFDEGYSWTSEIPNDIWCLSGKKQYYHPFCLNSLLELEGIKVPISPSDKFLKSINCFLSGSNINPPWSLIMPQDDHRSFVESLINSIKQSIVTIDYGYYNDTWRVGNSVLRSLVPAKVNKSRFLEVLEDSGMNKRVIEGLRPDQSGYASPILYDRFGTRTGRLTVASGPGILTMKKEYRNAIETSFTGGNIVSIDFSALEVRVLLHESGGACESSDLYQHISDTLFDGKVDRKSVKAAVIAESYGSSKSALSQFLKIEAKELDDFVEKIRTYLGIKPLRNKISEQYWKEGFIRNRYGRKINIDAPQNHIFINSYAQSTGVDVSLMGFSEVVKKLTTFPGVRPLFVLHDELMLDVSPERMKDVEQITSVKVPGYDQIFPLKMKILS